MTRYDERRVVIEAAESGMSLECKSNPLRLTASAARLVLRVLGHVNALVAAESAGAGCVGLRVDEAGLDIPVMSAIARRLLPQPGSTQ